MAALTNKLTSNMDLSEKISTETLNMNQVRFYKYIWIFKVKKQN